MPPSLISPLNSEKRSPISPFSPDTISSSSAPLGIHLQSVLLIHSPFVSASAIKFGKRPVFLFSSLFGIIGCIVGCTATGYKTLLASRILTGFSTSAYESVILTAVGDLYFVHQRGLRISLVNFVLAGISNGISIIAGVITTRLGWNYNFYILLPFIIVQFILLFLFVPETSYIRAHIYDIDTSSALDLNRLGEVEKRARAHEIEGSQEVSSNASTEAEKPIPAQRVPTTASGYRAPPPPKTFTQRLAVYTGVYTSDSVFKMVLSSILIMTNVGASWVIFISGLLVAWYVAVAVVSAQLFYAPPYLFNAASVGYTSTGPLIGGIIGATFCSMVMDPMLKFLTRRNKGV
jgi:MFS family permease